MNGRRPEELRLAFMLLSRLPVGAIRGETPALAASAWAWPLVGAVIGAISAALCGLALWLGLPPVMAATIALAASLLVTGAMHEDGLADVADGFGGGRDRARKLEIMRDSRIGSYGAAALILALGFRAGGIAALAEAQSTAWALIGLAAASRAVLPYALFLLPPARQDGVGRSALSREPKAATIALGIGFACLLPLGFNAAVAASLLIALAAAAVGALAMRQIGGQTGDVMGAMQQIAECAGWAVLASML